MKQETTIVNLADAPERREFAYGFFELVEIKGTKVGRATYAPGWKWSRDVGGDEDQAMCEVEHVGVVLKGCVAVKMRDGSYCEMKAGDVFHVPPGHDSWVVGDREYQSLHLEGAAEYAR